MASEVKPVVVSMGDVAASGGYYIACAADTIVAQPNTITGSIGVWGLHLNLKEFWNDRIGFSFDRITTGNYSDLGNPNRALLDDEKEIIQVMANDVYDKFINHVSEGRNMSIEMVDSFGRGRIWTGEQAVEIGLVDKLGGMYEAIEIAANMAGIEDYKLKILPDSKNPFEKFLDAFSTSKIKEMVLKQALGEDYYLFSKAKQAKELNGIFMLMPYEIDIR